MISASTSDFSVHARSSSRVVQLRRVARPAALEAPVAPEYKVSLLHSPTVASIESQGRCKEVRIPALRMQQSDWARASSIGGTPGPRTFLAEEVHGVECARTVQACGQTTR